MNFRSWFWRSLWDIWCEENPQCLGAEGKQTSPLNCASQGALERRRSRLELSIHQTSHIPLLISLHIRSMWETTVMHKQVSGWTVNFGPNSPVYPFVELKTRIPPPIWKTSDLGWPKFYSEITPPIWKTSDWDDPKLLPKYPPPIWKTSDLGWPKFTLKYPPPIWKTSDLGWLKFTPKYPPPNLENFRFGMDQSLLRNTTPPNLETSDLGWPKFTPKYPPPHLENFRFGMTKVYSEIPPPKTEIVREFKSKIFRIPRVTTCGDFIQPG